MNHVDVVGIRRMADGESKDLSALVDAELQPFDVAYWQRQLLMPGNFTYVIEQKSIFGFVSAGSADLPNPRIGELLGLYVDPSKRRQGWGRKLLVRGLSVLKLREFESACVYLKEEARGARALLTELGFVATALEKTSFIDGQEVIQTGYQTDLADYF